MFGETCSTYARKDTYIQSFNGSPQERKPLEYMGVYARIILKCIFRNLL